VIILTNHAVLQYISRMDRTMSAESAWEDLMQQLPHADRLKGLTSNLGDTLWRLPCGFLLVTKPGKNGRNHIVVTVLKPLNSSQEPTDEELELALSRADPERVAVFEVAVPYMLARDNESTVLERLENTIRGAMNSLTKTGIAGAVIDRATVTRKERG
jgi:hypothetical protein